MKNMEDSTCYKIGYILGNLVYKVIALIGKILWNGVVNASRMYKQLLITYILLISTTFFMFLAHKPYFIPLFITFSIATISYIHLYMQQYHHRKMIKYFNGIFEEINFYSLDNQTPYFLCENDLSDYATIYVFYSLIPLSSWLSKKELLEMYLNQKIIGIKPEDDDNQNIQLIVQTNPLLNYIEWNDDYIDNAKDILNVGIGFYGMVGMDLKKYPHAFIAGETGSGKSNILKCLIHQALSKNYDVILIDFKRGVSFSDFSNDITVYYDYKSTMQVLKNMVQETNRRLDLFRESRVDNLIDYNRISSAYLKRKIVFIDELAELLKTRDKEISVILYDSIETLTRLSRATGIHLIMGIQRPDSTIVNGQIKNNVSYRLCGRFVDKEPSRIMLGNDSASNLPNIKGRFVVKDNEIQEIQSFYYIGQYSHQVHAVIPEKEMDIDSIQPYSEKLDKNIEKELSTNQTTPKEPKTFEFDFRDVPKK